MSKKITLVISMPEVLLIRQALRDNKEDTLQSIIAVERSDDNLSYTSGDIEVLYNKLDNELNKIINIK